MALRLVGLVGRTMEDLLHHCGRRKLVKRLADSAISSGKRGCIRASIGFQWISLRVKHGGTLNCMGTSF